MAQYCLSQETLDIILNANPEEQNAHLTGLAKNAQQYLKYHLSCNAYNFMGEKVLTQHDVFPSAAVRKYLGLTGNHASKSFMDM